VVIRDVTANSAGVIAVAASAFSRDQQRVASVLIFVTVTGQIDRVVQTSPFASSRILFAPNGHLWAVGKVHDESFRELASHDILREYDEQGQLLRTALSTDSFKTPVSHPSAEALLVANRNRVGVYSQAVNEYIEVDLAGQVVGRWSTPAFSKQTVIAGAALTSSGVFSMWVA